MRNLLMILVMLLAGAVSVSAQTYYYKYLFSVNKDGAKFKDQFLVGKYITFVQNKACCYDSDANGNVPSYSDPSVPGVIHKYEGTQNGKFVYEGFFTYYFNSDYSRVNIYYPGRFGVPAHTKVFEKDNESEEEKESTPFY